MKKLILTLLIVTSSAFSMEEQPTKKPKTKLNINAFIISMKTDPNFITKIHQNKIDPDDYILPKVSDLKEIFSELELEYEEKLALVTFISYALEREKKALAKSKLMNSNTIKEAQAAIKEGAEINYSSEGSTPLHHALSSNNPKVAKFLIDQKADIHALFALGNDKLSTIDSALMGGCHDLAGLLIRMGVDVKKHIPSSSDTLSWAVVRDQVDIAKMVLEKGVNVNYQDSNGTTALMIATGHKNLEMVKLLLSYGAQVNIKNKKDETALDTAEKNKHKEIINILEKYSTVQKTMNDILEKTKKTITSKEILKATNLNKDVAGIVADYSI